MNKTLIVYDLSGTIIQNVTGFYQVPNGVPYLEIEIPQGKRPLSVNVETKEIIYEDIPPSEMEIVQNKISILSKKLETQTTTITNIQNDQLSQDDSIMQGMMGTAEVCEMVIMLQEQIETIQPTNPVTLNLNNKLGGDSAMVEVYANLVLAGKYTCNPNEAVNGVKLVPSVYREQVKAKLNEWAK